MPYKIVFVTGSLTGVPEDGPFQYITPGCFYRIDILQFLLRATGITAHIAISVAGILVLAVYTAVTKKGWKISALEIFMRVFYGIALITLIVVMKVHGIAAIAVIRKTSAALFVVLLAVLFVMKLCTKSPEFTQGLSPSLFWRCSMKYSLTLTCCTNPIAS